MCTQNTIIHESRKHNAQSSPDSIAEPQIGTKRKESLRGNE